MTHLLSDFSADVQTKAYRLLQTSAKKRTEHLVLEAGVNVDATFDAALPPELISLLQSSFEVSADNVHNHVCHTLIFRFLT
jgi:hypothetical protein